MSQHMSDFTAGQVSEHMLKRTSENNPDDFLAFMDFMVVDVPMCQSTYQT